MLRVLVAGDLHLGLKSLPDVLSLYKPDVYVLPGDILDGSILGNEHSERRAVEEFRKLLEVMGDKPVVFAPGNHESYELQRMLGESPVRGVWDRDRKELYEELLAEMGSSDLLEIDDVVFYTDPALLDGSDGRLKVYVNHAFPDSNADLNILGNVHTGNGEAYVGFSDGGKVRYVTVSPSSHHVAKKERGKRTPAVVLYEYDERSVMEIRGGYHGSFAYFEIDGKKFPEKITFFIRKEYGGVLVEVDVKEHLSYLRKRYKLPLSSGVNPDNY